MEHQRLLGIVALVFLQQTPILASAQTYQSGGMTNIESPHLILGSDDWGTCNKKLDPLLKAKVELIQVWATRAEQSVAGSWQEKYANKQFNMYVAEFLGTLKGEKGAYSSTEYTLTLLNFFAERINASRSDSEVDKGYKNLAMETFNVFLSSFQSEQTCRFVASEELMNMAIDFQKRLEENKPDSRARKIYEMYITKLGSFIPGQYSKELIERNLNFRQADTEGHKFYKQFLQSKPENALKVMYQGVCANAYTRAETVLAREVLSLNSEQTYQLIVEFQTKYYDSANYPQEFILKYLTILSEHHNLLRSLNVR